MTDAPDPGLTDLIAAHQAADRWTDFEYPSIFSGEPCVATTTKMVNCSCGESMPAETHAAHVALVVAQHTNGRMAELRDVKAERNELKAIVVRVRAVTEDLVQNIADDEKTLRSPNVSVGEAQELPAVINVQKIYLKDLRAALEGEQQ
ncbi:hypothetical protein [Rhodococcus sp. PvP104]|uniref:hypothetical protein n=1 Tax=Rhodococcus sp. PvP104 TaxID=2817911 RepID=UPI001AEB2870|nr:hypothetical protein [Rhodococcus sp. PvP104]MBP2522256.1 hypothetical protein [Rhodococcus sp. PvP104]